MRPTIAFSCSALTLLAAVAAAQTDVMFVTSVTGSGKLSTWPAADGLTGIAAGNRICQNLAAAAHLANADTFQAWLSDASTDAACNVKARSGKAPGCGSLAVNAPGPWARTDGAPFARSIASLVAGELMNVPHVDENGNAPPDFGLVWTGTDADGKLASFGGDCADGGGIAWNDTAAQGAHGYMHYGPKGWTEFGAGTCIQPGHLYCFQHSIFGGRPFEPFESDGALVFKTSTRYAGNFGSQSGQDALANADAICQARARAGGLPDADSFRAWLSLSSVDAIDHIDHDGPFKRPDGVQVASSKADLTDGDLSSPIAETELRSYDDAFVRTGTNDKGQFDQLNCFDFTQSDDSVRGLSGDSSAIENWTDPFEFSCVSPMPIYCFSDQPILFWSGFEEGGGLWRWSATTGG